MTKTMARATVSALAATALMGLAACGSSNSSTTSSSSTPSSSSGSKGGKIALLLPESKTTRYEAKDRPLFEAKVKALCSSCDIIYSNADQDASKQQSQAEAAITAGAKVLVLDPVDSASAGAIATRAKQSNIPVISYDRLILGGPLDYYVSFDSVTVGKQQGDALSKAVGSGKSIIMINGAPTDNNAKLFKQGAHSVLDSSGIKIAKEYDTPDWSPDKAQTEMDQAITAVGKDKIAGVYSANDGMAAGIVASMKGAGLDPTKIPVTGQDAQVDGIQRIMSGEQYVDVYKPIKPLAEAAATLAVDIVTGKTPDAALLNGKTDNGAGSVPSVLLKTTPVTKANVKATVFADQYVTAADACKGPYAAACKALGIS
ncbi:MAG: D-xylose transport system substrate-binding protein [Solirubrobacteraceae bacterium]|nr:D-xylose transport system substrate-binding protein [Solirubrobacteraceae bacterium]